MIAAGFASCTRRHSFLDSLVPLVALEPILDCLEVRDLYRCPAGPYNSIRMAKLRSFTSPAARLLAEPLKLKRLSILIDRASST